MIILINIYICPNMQINISFNKNLLFAYICDAFLALIIFYNSFIEDTTILRHYLSDLFHVFEKKKSTHVVFLEPVDLIMSNYLSAYSLLP